MTWLGLVTEQALYSIGRLYEVERQHGVSPMKTAGKYGKEGPHLSSKRCMAGYWPSAILCSLGQHWPNLSITALSAG